MRKIIIIIALAFIFFSCNNGNMDNESKTPNPLIGTWEGETQDVKSKFTFEKNNYSWEYMIKFPGDNPPREGNIISSTGTYTDHGTAFTLFGEMFPEEGARRDYQIIDDILITSFPQSRDPVHHFKIN